MGRVTPPHIPVILSGLYDAINGADIFAARIIIVANAFNTSGGIDHIDGIAFGDGLGWAFGQAGAARNAIFLDFHSHSNTLLN